MLKKGKTIVQSLVRCLQAWLSHWNLEVCLEFSFSRREGYTDHSNCLYTFHTPSNMQLSNANCAILTEALFDTKAQWATYRGYRHHRLPTGKMYEEPQVASKHETMVTPLIEWLTSSSQHPGPSPTCRYTQSDTITGPNPCRGINPPVAHVGNLPRTQRCYPYRITTSSLVHKHTAV